jgi:hypothetical protein
MYIVLCTYINFFIFLLYIVCKKLLHTVTLYIILYYIILYYHFIIPQWWLLLEIFSMVKPLKLLQLCSTPIFLFISSSRSEVLAGHTATPLQPYRLVLPAWYVCFNCNLRSFSYLFAIRFCQAVGCNSL